MVADWVKFGMQEFSEEHARIIAPEWINFFEKEAAAYKTQNVMMIWGDDFAH